MKLYKKHISPLLILAFIASVFVGCSDKLDEPQENNNFAGGTDFTKTEDMILSIIGVYDAFQSRGWEQPLLISVRGDDVNAGGLGDQQDFAETDLFNYNKDYWMYNSLWENVYVDVITAHTAMEQIARYQEFADADGIDKGNQYIAEAKVLRGMMLFQISQVWGDIFIPESSDTGALLNVTELPTKDEVMQHISNQMDEAISFLPDARPNERIDIPGGVTKYTALAIKALANQELKNYQEVAAATGQIINSGKFSLFTDYYELFKTPGKLSDESILDLQYSDFGQGEGDREGHLFAPYGPQNWTPAVTGAASGWGFYEPSLKFIKFMLDRGEAVRLETSVLFTDRGIAELQTDPNYATLPSFVKNTTRDGDVINDYSRALFSSGKHYLPSNQLIEGRTEYGSNKNYNVIRYAEILLMYAEAITQGATATSITADNAVNLVRERAGMPSLTGVTLDNVIDEKFAELGMEWGKRYYDMVRLGRFSELNYDGRTFSEDKVYLPYPQPQVDQFPILGNSSN
ncbi:MULTISPECIES: RagB/SusD family nutrient uptake outer membrane protein [Cellulophaga]|uniref:RagB/SusD domain-containing protein n=2 Tax=Cellulophaga TaxID=104264 RepID=F0RGS7_CELLC|nr:MULTISPECIES: RagB/SusD family nutrient uptake outer membrane protein [Cellulophaga]ADY29106.1 RagB/SusD domain-containing protein [Cellulophaga lytica DSM 7489]AIM60148.1 glycan metabolism protein RagB [Cellulophaga lytica]APU10013.1 glycan metabolism protein RagB [Cellulophaga lytica]EWH13243.1 RagB/SusD domain-containing protein [Cellulophaga geojensis KL-A]MDO6854206.1 RagB/SusD family nutrient uptake outer membrane protein [Cellulophaga lytica]